MKILSNFVAFLENTNFKIPTNVLKRPKQFQKMLPFVLTLQGNVKNQQKISSNFVTFSQYNTSFMEKFLFYQNQKMGVPMAPSGPPGSANPPYLLGWRGWFRPRSVATYIQSHCILVSQCIIIKQNLRFRQQFMTFLYILFITILSRIQFRLMQQAKMIFEISLQFCFIKS